MTVIVVTGVSDRLVWRPSLDAWEPWTYHPAPRRSRWSLSATEFRMVWWAAWVWVSLIALLVPAALVGKFDAGLTFSPSTGHGYQPGHACYGQPAPCAPDATSVLLRDAP